MTHAGDLRYDNGSHQHSDIRFDEDVPVTLRRRFLGSLHLWPTAQHTD